MKKIKKKNFYKKITSRTKKIKKFLKKHIMHEKKLKKKKIFTKKSSRERKK